MLVDTSVLVKWVHERGESEVSEARYLRHAHVQGQITIQVLDLAIYELGNVLGRVLGRAADDIADTLDELHVLVGSPVRAEPRWLRTAARIASHHDLTFYDACWAAAAAHLDVPLVTADRQLLDAGLGESVTATAGRLRELP